MVDGAVTFGPFAFSRADMTLMRDGAHVALSGRGTAILAALIDANGGVLTKEHLLQSVWEGVVVEDRNLTVQIAALRKVMGARPDAQEWIRTVSRVGYRLLREPPADPASWGKPSIVVLPFLNLSGDPAQDWFADGVVEDLITALSRFKTFSVVARNSAFVYKGRAVDIRQVANDLGVRYAVEGSVRRNAERVRVTAQLIDARSGIHLWANTFEGRREDVFEMQDEITEHVVGLIEPQITRAEVLRARAKRPDNLDAYDLYLQALPFVYSADIRQTEQAIVLLDRAVDLDPTFPQVLIHAAWQHEYRKTWGGIAPPGVDDLRIAIELAERALKHGENDAIVLALASIQMHYTKGDHSRGVLLIERALAMNPNSHLVLNAAGLIYDHQNEFDRSTAFYKRALQLSPGAEDNFWGYGGIAGNLFFQGRLEESIEWALKAVGTGVRWEHPYRILTAAYASLGRMEEARASLADLLEIHPGLTLRELHRQEERLNRPTLNHWIGGMRLAGLPEGNATH
jgi:TolB-like protein/DNA-binding winged helix-turn-helix (wHTH) protein